MRMSLTHSIPRARSTLPDKFLMPCLQLFSAPLKVIAISYFLNSYHIIYITIHKVENEPPIEHAPKIPSRLRTDHPQARICLKVKNHHYITKRDLGVRIQLGQTWNLSNLLHNLFPICFNFTREKHVNRDIFGQKLRMI